MDLSIIVEKVKALEKARAAFDDLSPKPGYRFDICLRDKVVIDGGDCIIRICPYRDAYKRIGVEKYFRENGVELFLPETIVEDCTMQYMIITTQRKVEPVNLGHDKEALQKIIDSFEPEKKDFILKKFEELNIIWFGNNFNLGKDENGKIWIFDYVVNAGLRERDNKITLVDAMGGVLTDVQ